MLDPGFLATVFIVSACVLTNDLTQECRGYLCPKAKLYLSTDSGRTAQKTPPPAVLVLHVFSLRSNGSLV
jgi:hypothetical protein